MSNWISVEEQEPPEIDRTEIAVCDCNASDSEVEYLMWHKDECWWATMYVAEEYTKEFTHWQLLPKHINQQRTTDAEDSN